MSEELSAGGELAVANLHEEMAPQEKVRGWHIEASPSTTLDPDEHLDVSSRSSGSKSSEPRKVLASPRQQEQLAQRLAEPKLRKPKNPLRNTPLHRRGNDATTS